MKHVLIVTGSRMLAKEHRAEVQCRQRIEQAVADAWLVVNGGATGPDGWSTEIACLRMIPVCIFSLNGKVTAVPTVGRRELQVMHEWIDPEKLPRIDRRRLPLERNKAMVSWVLRFARDAGRDVKLLALIHEDSKTHGTEHTVELARTAGIQCEMWMRLADKVKMEVAR